MHLTIRLPRYISQLYIRIQQLHTVGPNSEDKTFCILTQQFGNLEVSAIEAKDSSVALRTSKKYFDTRDTETGVDM